MREEVLILKIIEWYGDKVDPEGWEIPERLEAVKKILVSLSKLAIERLEGMLKKESCGHDQDGACYVKYGDICTESFNLALNQEIEHHREIIRFLTTDKNIT